MSKIRSLKPETFRSLTLASVPIRARWTFAGLWTYMDDAGRGVWDARLVKAWIYPLDEDVTPASVARDVAQLEQVGAVHTYEVEGRAYVHVPSWNEHQHPGRPKTSLLPPCSDSDDDTHKHCGDIVTTVSPGSAGLDASPNGRNVTTVQQQCDSTVDALHEQCHDTPSCLVLSSPVLSRSECDAATTPAAPAPAIKPKATPKKRTPAPDDFEITLSLRSWAKTKGFAGNLTVETEQFLDYHRAKGTLNLDWTAAWRAWVRNAIKWGPTAPIAGKPTSGGDW